MKTTFFALAASLVCLLTAASNVDAQTQKNILLLTGATTLKITPAEFAAPEVNSKALRDFRKNFPNVEGEQWTPIKDGWLVTFTQDNIQSKVVYSTRGDWQFSIDYYTEQKLPADVRTIVKSKYFDYSITGVEEVHVQDKIIYLVHMQDEKTWKIARISNGEMEIIEDFNKG
jgi:hypothetical protein